MNYTKQYLKSFGKITKKQEKIIKNTLHYELCVLADAIYQLKKEVKKSLMSGWEFIRRIKL